jgi:hypothetical protein
LEQKPGNALLVSEGNIRLGADFGLANRHTSKAGILSAEDDISTEVATISDAIEDIRGLLGGSLQDRSIDNYQSGRATQFSILNFVNTFCPPTVFT